MYASSNASAVTDTDSESKVDLIDSEFRVTLDLHIKGTDEWTTAVAEISGLSSLKYTRRRRQYLKKQIQSANFHRRRAQTECEDSESVSSGTSRDPETREARPR